MSDIDRTAIAWQLAADLARARGEAQAAEAVARAAAQVAGADAVRVWLLDRRRGYRFAGAWPEEQAAPGAPPKDLARAVVFGTPAAGRAERPHRSRLLLPLLAGQRPMGAIELLETRRAAGPFTLEDAPSLEELVRAADRSLEAVRIAAARETSHLEAVSRLTRLFDVSRSFASSLDLDTLPGVIANRVQAALEVEMAAVWLPDEAGEKLTLAAASGEGADAVSGWELGMAEGAAGEAAAAREARLFDDAEAIPGLEERPDVAAGLPIPSIAAVPVIGAEDGPLLAVIEVVSRDAERILDERDLRLLEEIASTAAAAITSVRRLDAERRASDLGSLLEVAQDLGSSLDLQRITFTLVHKAAALIPYRVAAVGLYRGTRLELAAVSGQTFVDEKQPEMAALRDLLAWAAGLEEGIYVVQEEDGSIDTERPETREQFRAYFEATGTRSFLTVPLGDDEGRLGVFALAAGEPYAFAHASMEAATLLAVQATGAIRNATLYQQIPMARVFQPLARRKQTFLGWSWSRRILYGGGGIVLAGLLLLLPLPLRVGGEARVLPEGRLPVTAEVEGRVVQVLVREGSAVRGGEVVAVLDDTDYRLGAEDARAALAVAAREQSRLRAAGSAGEAAVLQPRIDGLQAELDLWQGRLERTRIRAFANGIVATPRVEERLGASLARGDPFCEIVDPARQRIEVAVPERDAGLVADGMPVKVKLYAYPTRSFRASVERVGVVAVEEEGERVFLVRARLEETLPLRSGMTGRAKVTVGTASPARIVLRQPARWIWNALWGWLP